MKTKLQELRVAAGYKSAKDFAIEHGFNVGSYTNYEQGQRNLSLELAWKFADILQCSLDELAGRTPPPKPLAHSPAETELISYYRQCTPWRKDNLMCVAIDNAQLSVGEQKSNTLSLSKAA